MFTDVEDARDEDDRNGSTGFARDVLINVLANLIAAAIIYLLGVLTGLFPSSAPAIGVAGGVVLVAAGIGLFVISAAIWRDWGPNWIEDNVVWIGALMLGLAGCPVVLYPMPFLAKIAAICVFGALIVIGIVKLRDVWNTARLRRRRKVRRSPPSVPVWATRRRRMAATANDDCLDDDVVDDESP